ncbi:hypothetical protein JOC86_000488 [Bacillus pakistanensis]|uniref:Uncharacterized protein n=1 Tax=Rossellomorea pakistanensis TaxID=992288 RepID=A0ABS2N7W4_9BACI|nr:hypothetical protein [Bacillus pakistanensis]MBM7583951.1 hypothetical protein [Bacillus pakistanensis]
MKTKFKFQFLVILVLFLGATNVNAENISFFGRPKSITFKGENQNWLVVHQMFLIGTEIEYETKIEYKGNDDKLKNLPSLYYSITDKDIELAGIFSLKSSNVFHSERMECLGCKYLDKKKEITFIIGEWEDYEESLILKRG